MSKGTKYCIVPQCQSSSTKTPNKRFIVLPLDAQRRTAWLRAIRTTTKYSSKAGSLYVCEDHFDLEQDAENWIRLKYYPKQKVTLKKGVVPHLFECQPGRSYAQPSKERSTAASRARRLLIQSFLSKSSSVPYALSTAVSTSATTSSASKFSLSKKTVGDRQGGSCECSSPPVDNQDAPIIITSSKDLTLHSSPSQQTSTTTPRKRAAVEALCELASSKQACLTDCRDKLTIHQITYKKGNETFRVHKAVLKQPITVEKAVLAKPITDDKAASAKPYVMSKSVQCQVIGAKDLSDAATSPFKMPLKVRPSATSKEDVMESSFSADESTTSSSSAKIKTGSDSTVSEDMKREQMRHSKQKYHMELIKKDPMYYLGMPPAYFYLIDVLSQKLCTDVVCILFCIQKIRLNQSFKGLSYDFSVSELFCFKTFTEIVPALAECFAKLIVWPHKAIIKSRLPIYFRARFSHVQSIIDCFEVEIEKPSNPIKQSLTWSNYKKCNTLKYLISSTPDAYVNYVSKGFGGSTSDIKIIKSCGYLDVLPDGVGVMADRAFEGLAPALEKKKCSLIRPPLVLASQKSSKEEVKISKRIVSLRIHIERVIRRLREFNFLKPHACINIKLLKYLDCIVEIACGLVNLQEPIMRKFI